MAPTTSVTKLILGSLREVLIRSAIVNWCENLLRLLMSTDVVVIRFPTWDLTNNIVILQKAVMAIDNYLFIINNYSSYNIARR